MPPQPPLELIRPPMGASKPMPAIMTREDRAMSLVGCTLDARYRLDELLGLGGTAAVFRGTHLRLGCPIAIKVLHDELWLNPRARARFEREARGAARLDHPNCVGVIDVGIEGIIGYLVMPFVDGRELGAVVPFGMSRARAIELFEQLLLALEHAHALGIVHRDVKPENILLTHDHAGKTVVKLVDFGIAKLLDPVDDAKISLVGEVFGTPAYMSPEQIRSESASEQTDLYAAGLVFYEMLTGRRVYDGEDILEILRQQIYEPADLCEVDMTLRPLLEGLLAKQRTERFSTASEALAALRAAASEQLLEETVRSLPTSYGTGFGAAPSESAVSASASGSQTGAGLCPVSWSPVAWSSEELAIPPDANELAQRMHRVSESGGMGRRMSAIVIVSMVVVSLVIGWWLRAAI